MQNGIIRKGGLSFAFLGLILAASYSHSESPKAAKAASKDAASVRVDPKTSEVRWTGRKVTGAHNGTVNIKEGQLKLTNKAVTGGTIAFDMATIKDLDLTDAESNAKLTGHLRSDDFFGVEKFPTAKFEITEVQPLPAAKPGDATHQVMGKLTIKDITQPSSFSATMTVADGSVKASGRGLTVDRTLYNIRYGSGKFFQNLGDKVIYDEFTIDFELVAK